jgi:hypothetical protein
MNLVKLESVLMKKSAVINEAWVQRQIFDDPSIIGLGDLIAKDKERIHNGAGRLDILLQDPESLKRYEVEIQLGATDESHLIRTIEYWDIERKRYPQYDHAAVIIAEDITSRFLNVIQLFNGHIPIIAIKMTAYKIGENVALTFTKVVDEGQLGLVDDDEEIAEPTDRNYWETKNGKSSLKLVDDLFKMIKELEPTANLKYNKHYIGLEINGIARNFVFFQPRKSFVITGFKIDQNEEAKSLIASSDFEELSYDKQFNNYRVRVPSVPEGEAKTIFLKLATLAQTQYRK